MTIESNSTEEQGVQKNKAKKEIGALIDFVKGKETSKMNSNKPKWWTLYATVPLMLIGLFLILGSHWADWAKTAAAVVVILGTFVGMAVWMSANEGTIQRAEFE